MTVMETLLTRYPDLAPCAADIEKAAESLIACYENGGKVLICGNGGSCADGEHIVGELMKGFVKRRPLSAEKRAEMKANSSALTDDVLDLLQCGLPAIALSGAPALGTAYANDVDPDMPFAQQVMGYCQKGDVLIGISTSGGAKNVALAAMVAKGLGATVIGLTGKTGGRLKELSDISVVVPCNETYQIQERHLPIYHALCLLVEEHFFAE